jgi:Zn finger protein HypA/HybF involved in hydrogenase expression
MKLERKAKKCKCGRMTNPFALGIIDDAWSKNNIDYYGFKCPQCQKRNIIIEPESKEKIITII